MYLADNKPSFKQPQQESVDIWKENLLTGTKLACLYRLGINEASHTSLPEVPRSLWSL